MATKVTEYQKRSTRLKKAGLKPESMTIRQQLEADGLKAEGRSLWEVSGLRDPSGSR